MSLRHIKYYEIFSFLFLLLLVVLLLLLVVLVTVAALSFTTLLLPVMLWFFQPGHLTPGTILALQHFPAEAT